MSDLIQISDTESDFLPQPVSEENPQGKPRACFGCPALKEPGPVWIDGSKNATSGYAAEAPGREEVAAHPRRPLIGWSGQYHDQLLSKSGIRRADVRCFNAVACLPPVVMKNGKPEHPVTPEIFNHCTRHWNRIFRNWKPRHVHAMGSWAARRFVGPKASIDEWQGAIIKTSEIALPGSPPNAAGDPTLTFSIHPARAMRERMMMPVIQEHYNRASRAQSWKGQRRPIRVIDLDLHHSVPMRRSWGGVEVYPFTPERYAEWLPWTGVLYFDTETTNLTDYVIERISIATCNLGALTVEWSAKVREWLRPLFENPDILKVGHNLPFDWRVLHKAKITIPFRVGGWFDTMTAFGVLTPDIPNGLEFAVGYTRPSDAVPWKFTSKLDPQAYSGMDSAVLPDLHEWEAYHLKEDGLEGEFARKMRLLPIGLEATLTGLKIDTEIALDTRTELETRLEREQKEWEAEAVARVPERERSAQEAISEAEKLESDAEILEAERVVENSRLEAEGKKKRVPLTSKESRGLRSQAKKLRESAKAQREVKLTSPKQLMKLLYSDFGLPPQLKLGSDSLSTDEDAIETLIGMTGDPLLRRILEFRGLHKVAKTFFGDRMISRETATREVDGRLYSRLHYSINFTRNHESSGKQQGSGTRWSMTPSPQVMPEDLRHIWVADRPGWLCQGWDWKSAEIYAAAYMTGRVTGDWELWKFVAGGGDVYRRFASVRLRKPIEEVTGEERQAHKTWQLAINYGMGWKKAMVAWGCTAAEAKAIIAACLDAMWELRKFRDWAVETGTANRMLRSPFGGIRYFPDASFNGEMLNFFPQKIVGSMLEESVAAIDDEFARRGWKQIGVRQPVWIHDAIYVTHPPELTAEVAQVVHTAMTREWSPWMPGFQVPAELKVGRCFRPHKKDKPLDSWDQKDMIPWEEWSRRTAA